MKRSGSGAPKNPTGAPSKTIDIEKKGNQDSSSTSTRGYEDSANLNTSHTDASSSSAVSMASRNNKRYDEYFDLKFVEKTKIGFCKLCKNKDVNVEIKMQKSNTSGLKWHLQSRHKAIYDQLFHTSQNLEKSQQTLEETLRRANKRQILNEKIFQHLVVEWLSIKYLPFSFFDDETTQSFFRAINPDLYFPKRTAMTALTSTVYAEISEIVMKILQNNDSRISLTVDAWTSMRSQSYYGMTAHFIDDDWKLHSLAIDFIPCHVNHAGVDIAKFVYDSLQKSGLSDKIQGITVDNASVNTTFMHELEKILRKKDVMFDAEEQHFHSFAHVLNLAAQDVLKTLKVDNFEERDSDELGDWDDEPDSDGSRIEIDHETANLPSIAKLRYICKKIKRSEKLKIKLGDFCKVFDEKQIDIPLDVSTRWNSSYDMISAGLQMQRSTSALASNSIDLKHLLMTENEWDVLAMLQKYLKCQTILQTMLQKYLKFKQFSTVLCGDQYVTLPSAIVGVNILIDSIEKLCHTLDKNPDRNANDESIILAFQAGRDKLIKHYNKTNWIYCAVLILDPRNKLEIFDKTCWGRDLKIKSFAEFKRILATKYDVVTTEMQLRTSNESEDNSDDEYTKSMKTLYSSTKKTGRSWEVELENYLRLDRADLSVNICEWWRVSASSFPGLSRMARDLLAICESSDPVERLFSKAGLIIRKHRNRLSDENAEFLLCLNSWFQCSLASMIKEQLS